MCMFSRAVKRVSGTRIFARHVGEGRQGLVYAMTVAAAEPVAMCLPLPVAPGAGEDAVRFVDLSGYADFFEDCELLFPQPLSRGVAAARSQTFELSATLAVHTVGDFVASYVPSPRDFTRLDERFRLPTSALAKLPQYADWGFAVFQLAHAAPPPPKRKWWQFGKPPPPADDADADRAIHPMAFSFPTRYADALFFPTLHLHDGDDVPAQARYDHTLYAQTSDPRIARTFAWRASDGRAGKKIAVKKTGGLVDGDAPMYRRNVYALQKNTDHLIEPPACRLESLAVRDELWAFELAATAAYLTDTSAANAAAQQATARTKLDALSAGMAAGLRALVAEHKDAWQLAPVPSDAAGSAILLIDDTPMIMTDTGPKALDPSSTSKVTLQLGAATDRVEHQKVAFTFVGPPAKATIRAIEASLRDILDRAVA